MVSQELKNKEYCKKCKNCSKSCKQAKCVSILVCKKYSKK